MSAVYCPCCKRAWSAAPADRLTPWEVWEAALEFVTRETAVTEMELFGHRRHVHLVEARALFVWIVKTYTPGEISYPAIARHMGERDHTTIMHLWRNKIPQLLLRDVGFRALCAKFAGEVHRKETTDGDTRH